MRPAYLVLTGLLAIGAGALGWVLAGPKSSIPDVSPVARVEPSPVAPAPSLPADRTVWRDLLKQRQFDQLEDKLAALQADVEAGKCSECAATGPYYEFSTSDPLIGDRLDEWIRMRPESLPAHIARGMYRNHVSGLARGGAYAAQTRPERLAEMTRLHKAAVEDLAWVVQRNPKASLAYAQLIYIVTAHGGDTAAAKIYAEAIAHNPDSPVIYRARAWSLAPWWQGVLPRAVALYRLKAYVADLEKRFGDRSGFGWLAGYADYMEAETRARADDLGGAISYYSKAIATHERASYLLGRGDIYRRKKLNDLMQADLERALQISPENEDALFENGKLHRWLCWDQKPDHPVCQQATEELDKAVAQDPLNPEYLTYRAEHLLKVGRADDARHDLEQARTYGDFDPWLQYMAATILKSIDKEAAKMAFKRSVALDPDFPGYQEDYLRFLITAGDCEFYEAFKIYKRMCEREKSCGRLTEPPDEEVKLFQEKRGWACAVETWHEPRATLVLPD
jgi:tetratricopeptide (TPR) repeat protein